jgi:hypothetical protein
LKYADEAQHAFSAATQPSLHWALLAIETLYAAWGNARKKEQYKPFFPALDAAMAKLNEYYERTATSDAHIIAMSVCIYLPIFHILIILPVLDPASKLEYFKKHWGPGLLEEVELTVKTMVCFCVFLFLYDEMTLHIVY